MAHESYATMKAIRWRSRVFNLKFWRLQLACAVAALPHLLPYKTQAQETLLTPAKNSITALTSTVPSGYQQVTLGEWEVINQKVNALIDPIHNPDLLVDLALWCEYARDTASEMKTNQKFVYIYARDACITRIGKIDGEASRVALSKIAHNVYLDRGSTQLVKDTAKKLGAYKLLNEVRIDFVVHSPKSLSTRPLSQTDINFRRELVDNFWEVWPTCWPHNRAKFADVTLNVQIGESVAIKQLVLKPVLHGPSTAWTTEKNVREALNAAVRKWKIPPRSAANKAINVSLVLRL